MTVIVLRGFRWVASLDGVAHASPARRAVPRPLCGAPSTDERYARPAVVKCSECLALVDGVHS